MERTR